MTTTKAKQKLLALTEPDRRYYETKAKNFLRELATHPGFEQVLSDRHLTGNLQVVSLRMFMSDQENIMREEIDHAA